MAAESSEVFFFFFFFWGGGGGGGGGHTIEVLLKGYEETYDHFHLTSKPFLKYSYKIGMKLKKKISIAGESFAEIIGVGDHPIQVLLKG